MSFISLIFKNPFRNKSRALLAIVGIGIGIATIVALGTITDGLESSIEETLHAGESDFSISGKEEGNKAGAFGTGTINEEWVSRIKNFNGVNQTAGVYIGMVSVTGMPFFTIIGINPNEDIKFSDIKITKGKLFKNNTNELILGKISEGKLNKTVNDTILVNGEEYKVTGIFETGDPNQDEGAFTSIVKVQKLMDDPNNVSMIYVKVDNGVNVDDLTKKIENKYGKNITTITSIEDIETISDALSTVNNASWAISILAIIIGGIGIINTMIMSVYERTREIGVLKAVGWKGRRILGMIIGESLVLTITAAIVGSLIGIIFIQLGASSGILTGIEPVYTMNTFIRAFGVSIIVGLIGGFYPAWRASRLPPTEALRYE